MRKIDIVADWWHGIETRVDIIITINHLWPKYWCMYNVYWINNTHSYSLTAERNQSVHSHPDAAPKNRCRLLDSHLRLQANQDRHAQPTRQGRWGKKRSSEKRSVIMLLKFILIYPSKDVLSTIFIKAMSDTVFRLHYQWCGTVFLKSDWSIIP